MSTTKTRAATRRRRRERPSPLRTVHNHPDPVQPPGGNGSPAQRASALQLRLAGRLPRTEDTEQIGDSVKRRRSRTIPGLSDSLAMKSITDAIDRGFAKIDATLRQANGIEEPAALERVEILEAEKGELLQALAARNEEVGELSQEIARLAEALDLSEPAEEGEAEPDELVLDGPTTLAPGEEGVYTVPEDDGSEDEPDDGEPEDERPESD